MLTIGKAIDRISNEEALFLYLGNTSGTDKIELSKDNDDDKQYIFDENNITKAVEISADDTKNNIKLLDIDNFIDNDAKFYTCKTNGQDYLCFRCHSKCDTCVNCHSKCNSCQACADSCRGCRNCNGCNGCNTCDSYVNG